MTTKGFARGAANISSDVAGGLAHRVHIGALVALLEVNACLRSIAALAVRLAHL